MKNSSNLAKLFQTAPSPKHLIPAFQKHPELSAIVFTPGLAVVQIDLKRRLFFFWQGECRNQERGPWANWALLSLRSTEINWFVNVIEVIEVIEHYISI